MLLTLWPNLTRRQSIPQPSRGGAVGSGGGLGAVRREGEIRREEHSAPPMLEIQPKKSTDDDAVLAILMLWH